MKPCKVGPGWTHIASVPWHRREVAAAILHIPVELLDPRYNCEPLPKEQIPEGALEALAERFPPGELNF